MKKFQYKEIFKILFISLIVISYIAGFFLRENIAGGAESDFIKFTWPVIQSLKNDFSYTILNYGSFGEGSFPLFHIFNAYLNPFNFDEKYFQASITMISVFNVLIFSHILQKKYKILKIDAFLFSSIFLILPFFRSSAFWGLTENFGWLLLLISIKFYVDLERYKNNLKIIFLICLFSSLAIYTRPYLVFFLFF